MTNKLNNIIIWAENKPGVLYRILWLFRRKQFNIESATAGHSEIPGISRITITVLGNENLVKNMCKQLAKLIEVVKVEDVVDDLLVSRELALMKVAVKDKEEKNDILRIIEHFRGRVINMAKNSLIIEITGTEVKIDAFYENMKEFNIMEFVRTGRTSLFK
ncbi:acetolactate synthase small subunit [Candidatus Gottesmanbacteria bacterium RIFCSPHIGHO2_02_FULL_39_14]|uniref:Acetolactate synthase small subunit n=1 Tax=Candidatus Gottesmanbacteria bacterium RIFCSPHIGHO2_02_FULL_39_14 TaxID=1798383 RepID=A0A1F6A3R0_9BACT|nr:MAG: acetolactate synthase small subunit [Candidatus Gottesmanbacteria bacterium RIFCSPHIGHO2_02_FULL_39_14]